MEVEQSKSRYQKALPAELVPTGKSATFPKEASFLHNKPEQKIIKLYQDVIANIYRLTDSFSGSQSYFLFEHSDDFAEQLTLDAFQSLLSNGFISIWNVGDDRYNDMPFFFRVDIFSNHPAGVTDGKIIKKAMGHGFGKNPLTVFSQSLGEFIERYFLTLYHKKNLLRGSLNDLKKKGLQPLDLKLLAGFSEEQKKWNSRLRFDENSVFCWEKIKRISTGELFYAPTQLIYWNYTREESEPLLCEGNTNAAGGMFTTEGATLAGLYELIQRDAFMIYWLNYLTPKRVDPYSVPHEQFQTILAETIRYGFDIHCLNLTTDFGAPVFAVIISDPTGKSPRFCLGAGCQADPAKALLRAIEEAWSVHYWMRQRPSFILDKNYKPFREIISQDERLRLWATPGMEKDLEFFISGKMEKFSNLKFSYPAAFSSQKEELKFLAEKIEKFGPGYEVYYYEARHPLLSKINYHSVQAIVPQLVPLYLAEYNAPLGSRRLKEVPKKLGFSPADKFNPLPHLFP